MRKKIILKIFLAILFLSISFGIFVLYSYFFWRQKYIYANDNVICTKDIEGKEFDIDSKIRGFVLSNNKSEFAVFSKEEILYFLDSNIQTAGELKIEDICIYPEGGIWKTYFNAKIGIFNIPWVGLDIVKENRETAELYVKEIYLGGFVVPEFLSKNIISNINMGISDGLVLVNENAFLGRTIQNIELFSDKVVVKGSI
ncbi:MAG: hypothetical protein AB9915_01450 [Candidatus Dojkabacteria bacterium]